MGRPRPEANRAGQDARPPLPPGSLSQDHPAIRLAHDIEAQMTRLESVLAPSPEARARLGLAAAEDDLRAGCLAGA